MAGISAAGRRRIIEAMGLQYALFEVDRVPAAWVEGAYVPTHVQYVRISDWHSLDDGRVRFDVDRTAEVVIGAFEGDEATVITGPHPVVPGDTVALDAASIVLDPGATGGPW